MTSQKYNLNLTFFKKPFFNLEGLCTSSTENCLHIPKTNKTHVIIKSNTFLVSLRI